MIISEFSIVIANFKQILEEWPLTMTSHISWDTKTDCKTVEVDTDN